MTASNMFLEIGLSNLSIADVVRVARNYQKVADLSTQIVEQVDKSANWVEEAVRGIEKSQSDGSKVKAYYGINTGFGALAGKGVLDSDYLTKVLSRNLIASHSVGVGEFFDEEIVRATMLIRACSLAKGYSGVRTLIIKKFIDMLNSRVYPAVPSKGSLGASGDLAPLSHLILAMCKVPSVSGKERALELDDRPGEAFVPVENGKQIEQNGNHFHVTAHHDTGEQTLWRMVDGKTAMENVGGQVELRAKEGLALNNGATFSAAIAALVVHDTKNLLENAEIALAMSLEAARGVRDSFLPQIHRVRGHAGAITTAQNILAYTSGSELLDPGNEEVNPVRIPPQDAYSLRCAPQVIGAVRDTLGFVEKLVETEINAATDNPLIFVDELSRDYKTVSGGNFHGEPIALAMDFLGIAVTELGSIAERRIFKLTDYKLKWNKEEINENSIPEGNKRWVEMDYSLPSFLVEPEDLDGRLKGVNSGFMIPQYTAASLVSDCKTLAHPDSVDSIPSSANQEDHVSMSLNAARHAREIVTNIEAVVAIELYTAAQALSLRLAQAQANGDTVKLGKVTGTVLERIRKDVEYLTFDRVMYPDIRIILRMLRMGELVQITREAMS